MSPMIRLFFSIIFSLYPLCAQSDPIFKIQLLLGETSFPTTMGLYSPPTSRFMSITNQSGSPMPIISFLPEHYTADVTNSTCGNLLNSGDTCQLAIRFNPDTPGHFTGKIKICGHNNLWCSTDPIGFDITVASNTIVSTNCNNIQSRPYAALNCSGSYQYALNFYQLIARTLNTTLASAEQHFNYYQHTPNANETTINCIDAKQNGVNLDSRITGGGTQLCTLIGYASSNSAETGQASLSKLFPPYLTKLLGTSYPITDNTLVLDNLSQLLSQFGTMNMDTSVKDLGYTGYVNFLNTYYLQQDTRSYDSCGVNSQAPCLSMYYLPYQKNIDLIDTWPPVGNNYWGISGGGGSGAGYQIEAFMPGSTTHYTLFTGGGGGGGGNTTPESINTPPIALLNIGSGGGGGSQFANCYARNGVNLNGLGLGAGIGSGLSTFEGTPVTFALPPPVAYSYYPPATSPLMGVSDILTEYVNNLTYLYQTLIPMLYDTGYTITITGGGGGGAGLEFLDARGTEFSPQPVSIGYGFNFCYVFNKNKTYTNSDCISSSNAGPRGNLLESIIYQNLGNFYNQGMALAVKKYNGYSDYTHLCTFQHAYVICELTNLLYANHFTSADIPTWLINPHCTDTQQTLVTQALLIDGLAQTDPTNHLNCTTAMQNFYQAKTAPCTLP
jgi:hypothetical protein